MEEEEFLRGSSGCGVIPASRDREEIHYPVEPRNARRGRGKKGGAA